MCEVCLQDEEDAEFMSTIKILNLQKKLWRICYYCCRDLTNQKYIIHCLESELPDGKFDDEYEEFKCIKPFQYYQKVAKKVEIIQ